MALETAAAGPGNGYGGSGSLDDSPADAIENEETIAAAAETIAADAEDDVNMVSAASSR